MRVSSSVASFLNGDNVTADFGCGSVSALRWLKLIGDCTASDLFRGQYRLQTCLGQGTLFEGTSSKVAIRQFVGRLKCGSGRRLIDGVWLVKKK